MGQAILYCFRCSTQLRETHFQQGKAFKIDARVCCSDCAPEAIRTLPPDAVQVLLGQLSASQQPQKPPTFNSSRVMGAATPRRGVPEVPASRPVRPAGLPPVWIAAGGVAALVLIVLVTVLMSGSSAPPPTPTPPPVVEKAPAKTTPMKSPDRPPDRPPVDNAAREALQKAKDFAKSRPDDLFGQLRQFEDLTLLGDKTEIGNEARAAAQQIRAKGKEAVEKALAALDAEIAGPAGREEFAAVFAALDAAKPKMEWPEWKFAVDKRSREQEDRLAKLYEPLKEKVKEAKEKGNNAEYNARMDRVKKWGVNRILSDLFDALATVSSPPVKRSIETFEKDPPNFGYVGGWEFPGAKGSLGADATTAHGGNRSYKLSADFSGGGAYVGFWCDLQGLKERDVRELRLWIKTSTVASVGIRLVDNADQCHQKNGGIGLRLTNDWQEVVIRVSEVVGGEHWGGPNDGRWHGPLKGFGINVGKGSFKGSDAKTGTIWIDDIEAMIVMTPGRDE